MFLELIPTNANYKQAETMPSIEREDILSKGEVELMISKAYRKSTKALIALLYLLGCRISEALDIERKDIRKDEKNLYFRIKVRKRRSRSGIPFIHTVPINLGSPFVSHILDYIEKKEGKIFTFTRITAWRRIKKINPNAWCHLFRHTRLTKLAEKGATGAQLMAWAGWRSLSPAGVYVQRSLKLIENLAEVD